MQYPISGLYSASTKQVVQDASKDRWYCEARALVQQSDRVAVESSLNLSISRQTAQSIARDLIAPLRVLRSQRIQELLPQFQYGYAVFTARVQHAGLIVVFFGCLECRMAE